MLINPKFHVKLTNNVQIPIENAQTIEQAVQKVRQIVNANGFDYLHITQERKVVRTVTATIKGDAQFPQQEVI